MEEKTERNAWDRQARKMAKDKKMIEGQMNLFDLFGNMQETENEKDIQTEQVKKKETHSTKAKFAECGQCWCRDCKHNAVNEGVPRDICGNMQACPACEMCLRLGVAEICIIGSAKEGCSVRAAEEGILEE